MKTDKMLHFLASYGITLMAMLFAGYLGAIGLLTLAGLFLL